MPFVISGFTETAAVSQIEISEKRYADIKAAKATCILALEIEEKMALVLDNFYEFEVELLRLAQTFVIWGQRDHKDIMLDRLSLERRLVNLLTACRLYLDQTDHAISTMCGNISRELAQVKKFKNELYDGSPSYRFMEALRNHVQHAGLPVHTITLQCGLQGEDYRQQDVGYFVIPNSDTRTLLEAGRFKTIVKEALENIKQVDLRQPTREYMDCFVALHREVQKTIGEKVNTQMNFYVSLMKEVSTVDGHAVEIPRLQKLDAQGVEIEVIELVDHFFPYLDFLKTRNAVRAKFERSFASNTIDRKKSQGVSPN